MQGLSHQRGSGWCVLLLFLTGCTWVPILDGAQSIRVYKMGDKPAEGCHLQSEIDVTIKNRVGLYRRNPLKVQDELETLARNEAFEGRANAIQSLGGPIDGRQRFSAFSCSKP